MGDFHTFGGKAPWHWANQEAEILNVCFCLSPYRQSPLHGPLLLSIQLGRGEADDSWGAKALAFRVDECLQIHGNGWDPPEGTEGVGWSSGETHLSSKKMHFYQRRFLLTGNKAKTTSYFKTGQEEEVEHYSTLTVKLVKSRLVEWEIFNPDSSPVFFVEKGCWETGEEQGEDYHWPEAEHVVHKKRMKKVVLFSLAKRS